MHDAAIEKKRGGLPCPAEVRQRRGRTHCGNSGCFGRVMRTAAGALTDARLANRASNRRSRTTQRGGYHVKSTIILRTIYSKTIETSARILETCWARSAPENQGRRFQSGTRSKAAIGDGEAL
jgi:hypothetical protein